jgi:DUF4097 and DUF4098 domain-containing protein YvlB
MTCNHAGRVVAPIFVVLSLLAMGGCVIVHSVEHEGSSGGGDQAEYARTANPQVPRGTITSLDVDTRDGSIKITGGEVGEFAVSARIVGHAPTEQEAQELAEQTEILCEQDGNTLRIRDKQPDRVNKENRFVTVSYTITSPRQMNVQCRSSYGSVDVTNVEGTASLKSNNGSITADHLDGAVSIETSYGAVSCEELSGPDLRLKSNNGRITLTVATFGTCNIDTSYGAVACRDLKGDSIRLHSNNGSIELVSSQVKNANLSSSYGAIRATDITTADLKADSANGSIEVGCAPDCPADLRADVTSSYGSIRFAAPPQFAGHVKLSTSYGTVRTARPVTMAGEIDKKNITGTIGEGTGRIHLATNNGSVDLQ